MQVQQAARLIARLARLDEKASRAVSEYSHSAAATDRTRIACEQARYATAEAKDRAMDKARRQDMDALDHMMETVTTETTEDVERRKVVAELEAAGIKVGGWSLGTARFARDRIYSYQTYASLRFKCEREGKPFPAAWAEPLAAFEAEMVAMGLAV